MPSNYAGGTERSRPVYLHETSLIDSAASDIGKITDVLTKPMGETRDMDVVLRFDETDPPVGRVASGRPSEFSGWLGLLRVLSEALASGDGHRHELGPRGHAELAEDV